MYYNSKGKFKENLVAVAIFSSYFYGEIYYVDVVGRS